MLSVTAIDRTRPTCWLWGLLLQVLLASIALSRSVKPRRLRLFLFFDDDERDDTRCDLSDVLDVLLPVLQHKLSAKRGIHCAVAPFIASGLECSDSSHAGAGGCGSTPSTWGPMHKVATLVLDFVTATRSTWTPILLPALRLLDTCSLGGIGAAQPGAGVPLVASGDASASASASVAKALGYMRWMEGIGEHVQNGPASEALGVAQRLFVEGTVARDDPRQHLQTVDSILTVVAGRQVMTLS